MPTRTALLASLLLLALASSASAAVLCRLRSGVLAVRDVCRKKETPVDPVGLGLRGPQGEQGPPGGQGPKGDQGGQGEPGAAAPGLQVLSPGTATTLAPLQCYVVYAGGAAGVAAKGNLLSGWLQNASAQAIVPNFVVVMPGARNLSTQGGAVGSVMVCNFQDAAINLPAGWQLGLAEFDAP